MDHHALIVSYIKTYLMFIKIQKVQFLSLVDKRKVLSSSGADRRVQPPEASSFSPLFSSLLPGHLPYAFALFWPLVNRVSVIKQPCTRAVDDGEDLNCLEL